MTDKEIIQALRCCEKEVCADGGLCPLFSDADCIVHLGEAAADLIERLTAENAKAEAERDAIIEQIKERHDCLDCKHNDFCEYDGAIVFDCMNCVQEGCPCAGCIDSSRWEWRGLPEGGMMKGASNFDKLCHQVYNADGNNRDYIGKATGVTCRLCKSPLYAYYCEERLYLVECKTCKMKALVMAENPQAAAYRAFGIEVK